MGCCLGRQSVSSSASDIQDFTLGKNRPLTHATSRWRSEFPLTDGQLRSKRDEFWDTAPAFEGRKEVWDAIRAAAGLAEQADFALAQAILDGAGVSLPNGTLRESYDELGSRYQVPIYCLSKPINLVSNSEPLDSSSPKPTPSPPKSTKSNKKKGNLKRPASSQTIKLRISFTETDIKMLVQKDETVRTIKERLHQINSTAPDAQLQRWFFGGRYLTDRSTIAQCHIPHGYVVQVVSSTSTQPSPVAPRLNETDREDAHDSNNNTGEEQTGTGAVQGLNPGEVPSTNEQALNPREVPSTNEQALNPREVPSTNEQALNPGEVVASTSTRIINEETSLNAKKQKKKSKRERDAASARRKKKIVQSTVTTAV